MSLILYLLAAALGLCYLWVKKRFSYWSDRGIVSPPSSFPFGSLKGVGTTTTAAEAMDAVYKKYKDNNKMIGMFFFLKPVLLPTDPELIKDILIRDFASFHDRGFYTNKKDDPLSENLLTIDGKEWKDRRQMLSPIFTSGKMKVMFEIIDTIGEKLVDIMNEKSKSAESIEMRDWAGRFTADVIGNVAFGLDCKCLEDPNSEFLKHGRRLFDLSTIELLKFFLAIGLPGLCRKLGVRQNPKEPTDFFLATLLQTMDYREKNDIKRNDFVSMLLGLKEHFTKEELAAEGFIVYAAGFETSSTLIVFTLYELAINPDIQDRLRDEIKSGIEENDGKLTYDLLFGLKYLDMVVNESLRKYPPIPNTIRKCTKDYKVAGTNFVIPEGMAIELPTYSLHHDPEYYPQPEKFDPERFTPENIKQRHPLTFLAFGEGPRNCIGLRFGMMQSKLAILKLLQNFEFSPSDKTPIPMKFVPSSPFLAPLGGMWLKIKKIE